jgi:TPP-dependent 2-oxoacid decarboxylase
MVGALSALNAVAGAAAADLPLLVIVGGPNSHAAAERRMVHHAIDTDLDRCARCFDPIVSDTYKVVNIHEGQRKQTNFLY